MHSGSSALRDTRIEQHIKHALPESSTTPVEAIHSSAVNLTACAVRVGWLLPFHTPVRICLTSWLVCAWMACRISVALSDWPLYAADRMLNESRHPQAQRESSSTRQTPPCSIHIISMPRPARICKFHTLIHPFS